MSMTAKRGEGVRNSLRGCECVSKSQRRVRCCGAIDELIAQVGFARSICSDMEVGHCLKTLLFELYKVGAAVVTPPESKDRAPEVSSAMMDAVEAEVQRVGNLPGVLTEGSLFWERPDAAALDVARTICRRAERITRRLMDKGELSSPSIPAYLSRLADLLWLLGRLLELRRGIVS